MNQNNSEDSEPRLLICEPPTDEILLKIYSEDLEQDGDCEEYLIPAADSVLDGLRQRLPDIPGFGVFLLSVTEAAYLLTKDLEALERAPFDGFGETGLPDSERAQWVRKTRKDTVQQFETALQKSVESGELPLRHEMISFRDMLSGPEGTKPSHRLIHLHDLILWMLEFKYVAAMNLAYCCPNIVLFARREYALSLEVEALVEVRKGRYGIADELGTLYSHAVPLDRISQSTFPDENVRDIVAEILAQARDLESQMRELKADGSHRRPKDLRPASVTRRLDTAFKLIGVLTKLVESSNLKKRPLAPLIAETAKELFVSLSENTIRDHIEEGCEILKEAKSKWRRKSL